MCDEKDVFKNNKGDEDLAVTEIIKSLKSKKLTKKIPHLKTEKGKATINSDDPKQVEWFEEFKE